MPKKYNRKVFPNDGILSFLPLFGSVLVCGGDVTVTVSFVEIILSTEEDVAMSCDVRATVAERTNTIVCVFVTTTVTLAEEEIALLLPAVGIGVAFSDVVVVSCISVRKM